MTQKKLLSNCGLWNWVVNYFNTDPVFLIKNETTLIFYQSSNLRLKLYKINCENLQLKSCFLKADKGPVNCEHSHIQP